MKSVDLADPLLGFINDPDLVPKAEKQIWDQVLTAEADIAMQTIGKLFETDLNGKMLDHAQESVFVTGLRAMGFLASENREAYENLLKGLDANYWRKNVTWSSPKGPYIYDYLTSFSIQGLGLSGRDEAQDALERMRVEATANYLHRFAGDVVQAKFYLARRAAQGDHDFRNYFADHGHGEGGGADHCDGCATCEERFHNDWATADPAGIELTRWANGKMRGPRPPE